MSSAAARLRAQARRRLEVTGRARKEIKRLRDEKGAQVVLLSWPAGGTCLPAAEFVPAAHDVIIGHVAGCAIHTDLRQIDLFADQQVVMDVSPRIRPSRPLLRLLEPGSGLLPQRYRRMA